MTEVLPKPASHGPNNFKDSASVGLVQRLLGLHGRVMPDIKTVDKWPNFDGRVEVQNERGELVGPLSVQVKTLPKNHNLKFACPLTFLSSCEIEPCLLLAADNESDKVYWLYFDALVIKEIDFKNNKHTKTLHLIDSHYIDKDTKTYVEEWTQIIETNKQRIRGYDDLKGAYDTLRANADKTLGTTSKNFVQIHSFLDELNRRLDIDFPTTKRFFYKSAWKLGLAYDTYEPTTVGYTLFPIPWDKNDVQIKSIDPTSVDKIRREGLGFTGHFAENPIEDRPSEYAKEVIGSKVQKLARKKLLSNAGDELLAREFVFAFIDKFQEQMGLRPKDEYSPTEVHFGFYNYLPIWIEEAHKLANGSNYAIIKNLVQRRGYLDPDILMFFRPEDRTQIQQNVSDRLNGGSGPVHMANDKLDIGVFIELLNYLIQEKHPITRVYRKADFSRLNGKSGMVWNTFSKEDTEINLRIVFEYLQRAYDKVVANNFPTLRHQFNLFGKADKILVNFKIKDNYGGMGDSPGYEMFYFKSIRSTPDKEISIISQEQADTYNQFIWSNLQTRNYEIDGMRLLSASSSVLQFIYEPTPLLNLTYELLGGELTTYFGK